MATGGFYKLVESRADATAALADLSASTLLGLDCEGVDLSRRGELCIVQLCRFQPSPGPGGAVVYLFDVIALGRWLFDSGLRELLERRDVLKLTYDCRNDADALQYQYGVRLDGVRDLQLLAFIISPSSKRLIMGLGTALTKYVRRYAGAQLKDAVKVLFAEDPAVLKKRPIHSKLLEYCANDVFYFIDLFNYFDSLVSQVNKPLTWSRWEKASQNYADCKRGLAVRQYSQYESNPFLPLRIIPDTSGGRLVDFSPADTSCAGCRRWFSRTEIFGSKCLVCRMIDNRQ